MSDEYALCWNNFTENIVGGFSTLKEDVSLCDVTLAVEGKLLKAHKIVLSLSSPYFKSMFSSNPCQHPIIFLKDMKYSLVQNLLEFVYGGKTNVHQEDLQTFIGIAESLQIKGLSSNNKKIKDIIDGGGGEQSPSKKRSLRNSENDESNDEPNSKEPKLEDVIDVSIDDCESTSNEIDLNPVAEISMNESRFDKSNTTLKITSAQTLNIDSFESMMNERMSFENPCSYSSVNLVSSNSLLHGNCIFNRNNTVATQQGLKTYWLCKSYRISMCKARCITHQDKVISATGTHNHPPHNKPHEIPPGHIPNPLISEFQPYAPSTSLAPPSSSIMMQNYLPSAASQNRKCSVNQNFSPIPIQSYDNVSIINESNVNPLHFKAENH